MRSKHFATRSQKPTEPMSGGSIPRTDTRWWGWGDSAVGTAVDGRVRQLLASRGIPTTEPSHVPGLGEVAIPGAADLTDSILDVIGPEALFVDHESRVRHANGHSLEDLLARRSGALAWAPDAVVVPRDEKHVEAILAAAAECGAAVIPFGGGTSVTGGLTAESERPVISLDTVAFDSVEIDPASLTAWLGAGLRGPEVERILNEQGFTLGHFPQSWEYATVGGFAATRSAGQASNGYGRFDEMVLRVRLATPSGTIETPKVRHASEGPSLLEAALGSEGVLGVFTAVEVRIAPLAPKSFEAWILPDFEAGVELTRGFAQAGILPAMLRLSDRNETSLNIAMSGPGGLLGRLFGGYLKFRGRAEGALTLLGFEGQDEEVRRARETVRRGLARHGGVRLGSGPGKSWSRNRFHGPYLREGLLDLGLVVETFETAAPWSDYMEAHRRIGDATSAAMGRQGMTGEVLCHLSHAYPDAASLYYTVVSSPGPDGPLESWRSVKRSALDEIAALGLPVSHHHGVGRDHIEGFEARIGIQGVEALLGLKRALDPAGIMNPGCLFRESDRRTP